MAIRVSIVPHTHWDREWYSPFQTFRLRLVELLDDFLPLLEADAGYRHFLLDGQTAVLDDYLEIRPEAEERIRRLAVAGRLAVGPWMILMDEFMVSGETIVRNLQAGFRRAARLGGAMEVGYLPDMFGHVAQMPQILRRAGLDHAVVWRGVPSAIRATGFVWEALDGSSVRAEYLYGSYSNGRDMPFEAKGLIERARAYEAELGDARLDGMLLMNGTDHQVPQPWLGRVVAEANADQADYEFEVTSLADHVRTQPVEGLPTWRGELRSGARANVLMGVASNRVDVHQAAAAAERALERRAEPLAALAMGAERYPAALLDVAWRNLILNSAHDSSCACSDDEVVDQVRVRYLEARQIADGVARRAVQTLADQVEAPRGATVVVNPSPHARAGLVEVPVYVEEPFHFVGPDGQPRPAQVLSEERGERFAAQAVGSKIGWVLDMMRGQEVAGVPVKAYRIEQRGSAERVWDVTVDVAGPTDERVDVDPLRERLEELASGSVDGDEAVFHVRVMRPPSRRVLVETGDVPGYGWATFEVRPGAGPTGTVAADGSTMRNEHLTVEVDGEAGTFTVTTADGLRVEGLNRYVDGGDGGDTYNYSPPAADVVVDHPDAVDVRLVEEGPLRARIVVTARYRWPTHAEGDERSCTRRAPATEPVEIVTTLELRAGEPFVRVRAEIDNRCRDHRLRAHFLLPGAVDGSDAECAFAVVRRGLSVEGGPSEVGLPTFVSRRFVDCSDGTAGLGLVHDGLLEYEVVGNGTELALTLLRATGWLSRLEPSLRPNPAGPPVAVEGAQMRGKVVCTYAVVPHRGDWRAAGLPERADEVLVPLERVPVRIGGDRPRSGSLLAVRGARVSACHRDAGGLVVRLSNPGPDDTTAVVALPGGDGNAPARGAVVDLRGRPERPFDGAVALGPYEFVTVVIPD
jgi:hypothetical protein